MNEVKLKTLHLTSIRFKDARSNDTGNDITQINWIWLGPMGQEGATSVPTLKDDVPLFIGRAQAEGLTAGFQAGKPRETRG